MSLQAVREKLHAIAKASDYQGPFIDDCGQDHQFTLSEIDAICDRSIGSGENVVSCPRSHQPLNFKRFVSNYSILPNLGAPTDDVLEADSTKKASSVLPNAPLPPPSPRAIIAPVPSSVTGEVAVGVIKTLSRRSKEFEKQLEERTGELVVAQRDLSVALRVQGIAENNEHVANAKLADALERIRKAEASKEKAKAERDVAMIFLERCVQLVRPLQEKLQESEEIASRLTKGLNEAEATNIRLQAQSKQAKQTQDVVIDDKDKKILELERRAKKFKDKFKDEKDDRKCAQIGEKRQADQARRAKEQVEKLKLAEEKRPKGFAKLKEGLGEIFSNKK